MNLATKLVTLRKQKGLTQMELAERLNVTRQAISRWEVGAAVPGTENLKMLSNLYGVSVDSLLNDNTDMINQDFDTQSTVLTAQNSKLKRKYHRVIYIGAITILLVILVAVFPIMFAFDRNKEQPIPIKDLTNMDKNDYVTYTFSIE